MKNARIILLSLVMVIFVVLLIIAWTMLSSGAVTVYGDEYVTRYFQRDRVMQINIEIDEADWGYLMENAMAEEFRTATVTVNSDVYPLVQIRPKGNSSLMSVARSDSDRYSFKINFSQHKRDRQTMAGLTQLNLNNCFSDPSYMREYLSYQIFEKMGVAVPAFSYAAVHVNGEYFGLYLAVESILEPYLERNFGEITGDLYKSVGNTLEYKGDNPLNYSGLEVKSTLKNADWSRMIKMLNVLNNGGEIEKYLDVDAALRYIAVNTALTNYDSYQGNFGHNYYLYEQNGLFTILPWDLNMSFGGFGFGLDASNIYIDEPVQGRLSERPLVARLLENEEYLAAYHGYLEEIATKYLSGGYLEAEIKRLFELISEYVRTDPTAFYSYEQFEQSISGTITGGAMGEINQVEDTPLGQEPEGNNVSERQGFRMGGVRGFGGNIPGILELAASMTEVIQKQLAGELPSTNEGNGMGNGMRINGDRRPDIGAIQPPAQQPPDRNMEGPAPGSGFPQPGGMMLNEGLDMAGDPGRMIPGGMRPEDADRNHPIGMVRQKNQPVNRVNLTILLVSGATFTAGIIMVLLFKRRRYLKV